MKNKKVVKLMAVVTAMAALTFGAFSYFTDYASKDLEATAGTLTMEMADATTDLTNGLTILNPGDSNDLKFTINNTGSKSMDVKAVMTVALPEDSENVFSADHEYKITDGSAELTGVVSDDNRTITYTISDVALAGSVEKDAALDGATVASHTFDYQFVMDEDAKNAWQGQKVSVTLEAFAKQHRNTSGLGNDWTSIVEK